MEVQVYRTNSSSYQGGSFTQEEKAALEAIPGVSYIQSLTEIKKGPPFVLISNTHTTPDQLPSELLEETVLWIHPNSGFDNFSKKFVEKASFPIVLGNPVRAAAVAEYILGCVFKHFATIPNQSHWVEDRKWDRSLLRDQKVLILGMGLIGKTLFQALRPLCPNLCAVDPYLDESTFNSPNVKKTLETKELQDVTVVLTACSLSPSSEGMINKAFLTALSSHCLIVNAARGEIVQEDDLENWLRKNPKAMAYLDVFKNEPYAPGLMAGAKNINKTSHIAGVHKDLNQGIIDFERSVITEYLDHAKADDVEGFKRKNSRLILSPDSPSFFH